MNRLNHVDRNTNGTRLIGDGAGNRLPNPPCRVGGEFITFGVVKLFDSLHQPHVAFLNQVEEVHSLTDVTLGD